MINLEKMPVDITEHIRKFRNFLNICWPCLDELMENHDWNEDGRFIDDWLQLNWELLVERELLGNEGVLTQFSGTYLRFRITSHQNKPIYKVVARSNKPIFDIRRPEISFSSIKQPLRLYSFCTYKSGAFGLYPPFDLANLVIDSTKELFVFPLDNLQFYLEIENGK